MKRNLVTTIVAAALIVIFAMLLFSFQVRQSEVAVVTTFGKPVGNITEPNLYFKWPWPIQKIYKFDNRVQNFEDRFSENQTRDQITILTSVYIGWRISDGQRFLQVFKNGSVPAAQQMLEVMLRSAKNAVIASNELSGFVNSDPQQLKFEEIENKIKMAVQTQLSTNNVGINIEFLGFKKIGLPESVTQTVFDRMKSERQSIIVANQSLGDSEAMKIKSTAERQAAETISKASAEAIQIRAAGEAEAAKTFAIFQQNPELANFLLRIDAWKQSLNQHSTLIFDERYPPFDLFKYLPTNSMTK
ncbi:MAG TPA: protease modulator HflC [Methylomirabilota bacterium]|nr:protease modulator HflC [Methylomirabilota bacterium]